MSKKSKKKAERKQLINKVEYNVSKSVNDNNYFCGFKLNKKTPDNYEW